MNDSDSTCECGHHRDDHQQGKYACGLCRCDRFDPTFDFDSEDSDFFGAELSDGDLWN